MVGNETCWESGLNISKDNKCPHCETAPTIHFSFEVWRKVMALTKQLSTEWLGYLHATQREDGDWEVNDITVPKQEVGGASVIPTDTVHSEGVIHSHVNMKAFFSPTDNGYLNENHKFSVVVNKSEEYDAVCRMALPCNALTIVKAEIEIEEEPNSEVTAFLEEAKKNIEEKVYTQPIYKNAAWDPQGGYQDQTLWDSTKNNPTGPETQRNYRIHSQPVTPTDAERAQINHLVSQINTPGLSKKKRKALIREANSLGVTLSRRAPQAEPVPMARVTLPDLVIENFPIEGKEVSQEGTIIGYYCKTCGAFANIANRDTLIIQDRWTKMYECLACSSFEVEPIIAELHVSV